MLFFYHFSFKIVSKKRFIYGFESLFGGPEEGIPQEETPVIALERSSEEEAKPKPRRTTRRLRSVAANAVADTARQAKRSSSKDFTSDLESLFMDAMKDAFEEDVIQNENQEQPTTGAAEPIVENATPAKAEMEGMPEEAPAPKRKRRVISSPRTRGGGLDLLIRQTSDEAYIEYQSENKRVTFVFDKKKLEKLKKIAKSQKAFLKDIIGEVVSKYIEEYEDSKGL